MKVLISIIISICLCIMFLACTDSSSTSPSLGQAKTETILGLASDHSNTYQKFDSLVTIIPYYELTLDTSIVTYTVKAVDQAKTKYDISISGQKLARLIISGNAVSLAGYYQKINEQDSLFHFISPSAILPNRLTPDEIWEYYVAPIYRDNQPLITTYLNFGFGYDVTRTYLGEEDVVVPSGAYRAHLIQTEYCAPNSELVVKTDLEYLVAGIGLVRMYSYGNFGSSHTILISTDIAQ